MQVFLYLSCTESCKQAYHEVTINYTLLEDKVRLEVSNVKDMPIQYPVMKYECRRFQCNIINYAYSLYLLTMEFSAKFDYVVLF